MDQNELKQLWTSTGNRPTPEMMRAFVERARTAIEADRKLARVMLIYVIAMALAMGSFGVWQGFSSKDEGAEVWYAQLLLAATCGGALALARHYFRRLGAAPGSSKSIRVTLEALHARLLTRTREVKTLLTLFVACIPLVALAILQLQANGKMRAHEAVSAGTLAGLILACGIGWFVYDLVWRKKSERQHLEALLREYQA